MLLRKVIPTLFIFLISLTTFAAEDNQELNSLISDLEQSTSKISGHSTLLSASIRRRNTQYQIAKENLETSKIQAIQLCSQIENFRSRKKSPYRARLVQVADKLDIMADDFLTRHDAEVYKYENTHRSSKENQYLLEQIAVSKLLETTLRDIRLEVMELYTQDYTLLEKLLNLIHYLDSNYRVQIIIVSLILVAYFLLSKRL